MQARTALFGAAGVLATSVGAALLFVPDLFVVGPVEEVLSLVETIEATTVAVVAGLLAMGSLLVIARSRPASETVTAVTRADPRFERAATVPPEEATAPPGSLTAASVDADAREAIESGGEALADVRSLLRETATSACADREELPETDAAALVECGEWTDDPVAAVFLAGTEGPSASLSSRLRLWLAPGRERARRLERTVAAIERVSER